MAIIDIRTIAITLVLTNLISAHFISLLWVQNRKRFPSIRYWVLDISVQTVAVFLIALRGFIPDWLSVFVATSLVIIGAIAAYLGTAYFFRQTPKIRLSLILFSAFLLIHGSFFFI